MPPLRKPTLSASLLTILCCAAFFLRPDRGVAQDDPSNSARRAPDLSAGLLLGYANHFGRTSEIDGTTSATVQLPDRDIADSGIAVGLRIDAGLLPLGKTDLGLSVELLGSFPDRYLDLTIMPRYRLNFATRNPVIGAVEPWLGVPLVFTFADNGTEDFFFAFGGALGCDLGLGHTPWRFGLAIYVNAVNPKAIETQEDSGGGVHRLETRLDNILVLLNASYVFF